MKKIVLINIVVFLLFGCQGNDPTEQKNKDDWKNNYEQLNISVLLDLSDRIIENTEKDLELLNFIANYFKSSVEKKNIYTIEDQIKVLFYPIPNNDKIYSIADSLSIKFDPSDREKFKATWQNLTPKYQNNLSELYKLAAEQGEKDKYPGSDIYRFFSDRVSDYCIENDKNFRNVLILLTDGYMYHKQTQLRDKNKTTYLTGTFLQSENLRNADWETRFETENYGFISMPLDLSNLEILVLEINPSGSHRNDIDIIKKYWSKWLAEMNVKNYQVVCSDVPVNTKELIARFLDGN